MNMSMVLKPWNFVPKKLNDFTVYVLSQWIALLFIRISKPKTSMMFQDCFIYIHFEISIIACAWVLQIILFFLFINFWHMMRSFVRLWFFLPCSSVQMWIMVLWLLSYHHVYKLKMSYFLFWSIHVKKFIELHWKIYIHS